MVNECGAYCVVRAENRVRPPNTQHETRTTKHEIRSHIPNARNTDKHSFGNLDHCAKDIAGDAAQPLFGKAQQA
ncbi:MAG: hypothetical protein BroJett021_32100 [Chloroflexota bacterium]|nr:MAG: hypothetical protein BroJett021_32100 [Chloroflexota bacterium]